MKNKSTLLLLFLISCFCNPLQAQYNRFTFSPSDTNYNDIVSHYLYGYSGTNPYPNADNELNHFRDWQSFWQPRVAPTGSFKLAAAAKRNNSTLTTGSPTARTSSAITSNWSPLGPSGDPSGYIGVGRINAIAFDPNYDGVSNKTMYCGGENSGLWKYDGTTWTTLNTDDQLAQLGVADIEIDPVIVSPNTFNNIYIATSDYNLYSGFNFGSAGVYFSADNGAHWNPINSGLFDNFSSAIDNSISKILIDPTNSTDMYAATSDGIYKCSNRQSTSASWTRIYPSATTAEYTSNILFDPADATFQTLYSVGFNVMKSTDGGTTWTSLTGSGTGLDLTGTPNLTASPFGTTYHSGSLDNIRDMNSVISSDGRYLTISMVTVDKSGPPYYWNTPNYNYIFQYDKLATGSTKWTQKTSVAGMVNYIYRLAFQVSPANNNTMFIGHMYLTTSTDGALSWYQAGGDLHSDVRAIEFDPSDPTGNTLFIGNDGGVFKTTVDPSTGIFTVSSLNNGLNVATLYSLSSSAIDPYQIEASMQDDGNNYLKNNIWSHLNDFGGDGFQSVMDYKNENVFYSTNGAYIQVSDNDANNPNFGGDIKPSSFGGQYGSIPLYLNPLNPSSIYAGGGDLWKSTKGDETDASTWTQISDFSSRFPSISVSVYHVAIAPSDTQTIYVSDFFNTYLFRSRNGGGTGFTDWADISPSTGNPVGFNWGYVIAGLAVSTTDSKHLWIGYSGYDATLVNKVQESKDGGDTWSVVPWVDNSSNPLPNLPINYIAYETGSNDGIYVATDVGVYYHNNFMTGFEPFMTGLPNVIVNWLEINYTANKIRAATYGRGVWESDLACPVNTDVTESTAYSANAFVEAGNNLYSTADDAGYNVSYRAVNEVDLQPGFHASAVSNTSFHAFIHGCSAPGNSFRRIGENPDGSVNIATEEDEEEGEEMMSVAKNKNLTPEQRINVIPNPNGGIFTLKINDDADPGVYTVRITDISGRMVKDLENVKDKNIKIDLTGLPGGFYFLQVTAPSWQTTKKVIIQN